LNYTISHIARILEAETVIVSEGIIEHLLIDSRKTYAPATSLFFALRGPRRNGHHFITELYKKGVMNFVVSEKVDVGAYPGANILKVDDSLDALQKLATHHRRQFRTPVIGITGSNGKTIVKEWLYQLLHPDQDIVRSPKSYNSQIGVPLSVWAMSESNTLGIFEAGISMPGEMARLAAIIQPTIGILTNIGEAHSEGFSSPVEKAIEKMKLFSRCNILVYGRDSTEQFNPELSHFVSYQRDHVSFYHWSRYQHAWLSIKKTDKAQKGTTIHAVNEGKSIAIEIPFTDDASIDNAITCWCTLLAMGYTNDVIAERMAGLVPVNMRLELKKGINHCAIINDSYSADLSSLEIALDFLDHQAGGSKRTVILSDFLQTAARDEVLYPFITDSLQKHNVTRLIGIGEKISSSLSDLNKPGLQIELYLSTEDFLKQFLSSHFKEETILVKGARVFQFERIVQLLEQKVHQTVLEIDLNSVVHNLKQYQRLLKPSTKVMAMVKAFAYGSGGAEIAGILQYHKVEYLGVAYADEGVELRKAGITLPIMVMNAEENTFDALVSHHLEPDIYSFDLLLRFDAFLKLEGLQHYPVHLEIETGMNRLGFSIDEIESLSDYLVTTNSFKIQSVFTHPAASEEQQQDAFTKKQFSGFVDACKILAEKLGYPFLRHFANSAGILRHAEMQLEMVRLGIGLYGIDSAGTGKLDLQPVTTLKSTIAQVKHLKKGDTVSYNRKGVISKDADIATVRIGYADGYSRRLGNGVGKIWVKGKLAPVVGTVCMDMTMIDVTGIPGVVEGDDVIIFGKELPLEKVAEWAETIPYEVMTSISQRVKRVYFEE
jgi:Alr-MurF fusion protein